MSFLHDIYIILHMRNDLTHLFRYSLFRIPVEPFPAYNLSNKDCVHQIRCKRTMQWNFNGSNRLGTIKISSNQGSSSHPGLNII